MDHFDPLIEEALIIAPWFATAPEYQRRLLVGSREYSRVQRATGEQRPQYNAFTALECRR